MKTSWLPAPTPSNAANFVQGFIASGLLATIQNQPSPAAINKRNLRLALQGATALTAGCAVARAWQQRSPTGALTALALGVGGMLALEHVMNDIKEKDHGQEKT